MKKLNKKKLIILCSIIAVVLIAIITSVAIVLNKKDPESQSGKFNANKNVKLDEVTIVDVNSKSRPYAVMINNLNEARQVQSGLSKAYMVYEILAEGGITRYLALFKDADDVTLGSVRSARHYYLDYVLENDAIFVHWGYSTQAKSDISTLKINNINGLVYEGKYFYRYNPLGLSSEHTGFTTMEKLKDATKKLGYRDTTDKGLVLNYSKDAVDYTTYESSEDAKNITLKYSSYTTDKYEYDETTKMYTRFVNGAKQRDYMADKDITVKNIIVYQVNCYQIAGDKKNRINIDNVGEGEGYYISEGKAVKIKWNKKDRASKTIYTLADGKELKVNDGNTFIQVMPLDGSVVIG